jgi:RimJ/RimL family protein N-acetyltransferase
MHRILDDESLGGMNLRRCQWFTNSLNKPSQAAALRLGYTFEGILRSHRMLPVGKRGAHGECVPPIIPVFRNMPARTLSS